MWGFLPVRVVRLVTGDGRSPFVMTNIIGAAVSVHSPGVFSFIPILQMKQKPWCEMRGLSHVPTGDSPRACPGTQVVCILSCSSGLWEPDPVGSFGILAIAWGQEW